MPRFEPFPGLRYDPARFDAADVTAPPYDVIDGADRAALLERHPDNAVRIDLPLGGPDPYADAAATFRAWQRDGVLLTDAEPSFYAYRMAYVDEAGRPRRTTGVLGALELSRPGEIPESGGQPILPHEFTTPKAKTDRLDLLRATAANLSGVWGLSPAAGLTALLPTVEPPLASWDDADGVTHSVWRLTDPEVLTAISAAIASEPVVIADGHHRYETSLAYRDERRAADGPDGDYDLVLTYVVELAEDELTVLPIHRLVSGLPQGFDLLAALAPFFEPYPAGPVGPDLATIMTAEGVLTLVLPDGAWFLRPRPEAMTAARDLDSSRLDVALAALPPHDLVFQHGVEHVRDRVESGAAQAGVLLRPASVDQIVEIARGGERMPPKTTFFSPKPRTGVVFRTLG